MMEEFNREEPLIFNTIQMYRTDRLEFLKQAHREAQEKGYILAVKLVRGAYMEKERERAAEKGYPSPIQPDKASTDRDYNAAVDYCLDNIDTLVFVAATHNEQSTQMLVQKMQKKGIPADHPGIFFSQLYGMSDNLSYVLAKNGYHVSKYVPYGPVKETLPYLIRRARENTSVIGQMSRELERISEEIKRRKSAR
jgi:proline dehydrogenase